MIAEAFETLWLLILAGGLWFVVGSIAVGLVLTALTLGLCAALRRVWRLIRPHRHPRPSWARTRRASRAYARRHPDYDEAA